LAVVVAWVFFRAESFAAAKYMLWGMVGGSGFDLPTQLPYFAEQIAAFFGMFGVRIEGRWLTLLGVSWRAGILGGLLAAVMLLPNSQQMLAGLRPALQKVTPSHFGRWLGHMVVWRPFLAADGSLQLTALTGFVFASLFLAAIMLQALRTTSLHPFIYFQF
jgi:alginate O-acetyltransferase complex protein AlgI